MSLRSPPPSTKQKSFSDLEYAAKKKLTRRDRFLAEIDSVTPWGKLHKLVEPFYPKGEDAGRPPIGLARMLRMYVAQQCFGLSDESIEDAIYDSQAIRAFVCIDLGRESGPDATTLLKFRHLLESKQLTRPIFDTINGHLAENALMMREGNIVDATLIAAPPSTKNKDGKRDPEMHQSKKGNDWHFGMTAHIGVDATSGLVHTVVGTAGNVSDVTQAHALLHGDESAAFGDAGYQGMEKRSENVGKSVAWHVAMKRSKRKALPSSKLGRMLEKLEHFKASVRAKVAHPFMSSRACSVIAKRAIAAWRKTPHSGSRYSPSPIHRSAQLSLGRQLGHVAKRDAPYAGPAVLGKRCCDHCSTRRLGLAARPAVIVAFEKSCFCEGIAADVCRALGACRRTCDLELISVPHSICRLRHDAESRAVFR